MMLIAAAFCILLQAVQGGVVPAPARFVAAPVSAPIIAAAPAPFVAPAAAPLFAAPAPIAYAKTVGQSVAPFAASVNYVARSPILPYTVGSPVVSPFVETFSAPLVARKFAPVAAAAPLVAAPAPFVGAGVVV